MYFIKKGIAEVILKAAFLSTVWNVFSIHDCVNLPHANHLPVYVK